MRASAQTSFDRGILTRRERLQATSKSFLGFTLYINVLAKASFTEATAVLDSSVTTEFNQTAFCLHLENFTSVRDG